MKEYSFIDEFGIDKAKIIIDNVINGADYYSTLTRSYYSEVYYRSSNRNDAMSIKKLKSAIKDYEELKSLEKRYKDKVVQWFEKSVKEN